MKKVKFLIVVALMVASTSVMAQQKIGIISSQELLMSMPEITSINTELQGISANLMADMEAMQKEYNQKLQEYEKNVSTYSQIMREQKEKDLQTLYVRIQDYQSVAQQEMSEQQTILMRPVQERLMNAINKVSADNSFAIVLDKTGAVYVSETLTQDITPLVMTELGVEKLLTAADLQQMQ